MVGVESMLRATNPPHTTFAAREHSADAATPPEFDGFDWTDTPLGPPELWSDNLRAAIREVLASKIGAGQSPRVAGAAEHADSQTPFMFARFGCDLRLRYVSRPFAEMFGCGPAVVAGAAIGDIIGPGNVAHLEPQISRVLAGNRLEFETELSLPDGKSRMFRAVFRPERERSDQVTGWLASLIDITERKRAEEARQETEAEFRAFFENVAVGAAEQDAATHRLTCVNDRLVHMLGHPADTLCGLSFADFTHPDDRDAFRAACDRLLRGEVERFSREQRLVHRDGDAWWASVTASLIHDGQGRPARIAIVVQDISERRAARERLRKSEQRLQRALQIGTVGIAFFKFDGRISGANEAFAQMSGYPLGEIDAGCLRRQDLLPSDGVPHIAPDDAECGRPREQQYVRKDGSRRWGLFATSRIDENEFVEFIIDVTEAKSVEAELQRYRVDLETLAHERTAELDAVVSALRDEALEHERSERERHELLRQLVSAQEEERRRISRELHDQVGQHATALILGLKSLDSPVDETTRVTVLKQMQLIAEEIGREVHELALKLRPTALDDLGLLRTLSNYVEDWSARTKLPVDFHSSGLDDTRLPPEIESTLYRIAQEALTNVVKHAQANRVSLILERRADHALAIIEDDGCGFEVEQIKKSASGKRLGLLGMHERAGLVGGELSIESTPGRGTTVFVRIPLRADAAKKS